MIKYGWLTSLRSNYLRYVNIGLSQGNVCPESGQDARILLRKEVPSTIRKLYFSTSCDGVFK